VETRTRKTTPTLAALKHTLPRQDFYQAVSLLKRGAWPVKYKTQLGMQFPNRLIERIETTDDHRVALYLSFIGLAGQSGALPEIFSEMLLSRLELKDTALVEFLDIFVHRISELLYQTWQRHRFYAMDESSSKKHQQHPVTELLLSFIGKQSQPKSQTTFRSLWASVAGHMSMHAKTAEGLAVLIGAYCQLPVVVNEYKGSWHVLPEDQCTRLTHDPLKGHNRLGLGTSLGGRVWMVQQQFEIEIGPVMYKTFLGLLPSHEVLKKIQTLVEGYLGRGFDYFVTLRLKESAIPRARLANKRRMNQLGWNTWLGEYQLGCDARVTLTH
jgi:type VI secretion system protein ImpH